MIEAIDRWVRRLNKLAREMDETCESMHPSAWAEATEKEREQWHRLAKAGPMRSTYGTHTRSGKP